MRTKLQYTLACAAIAVALSGAALATISSATPRQISACNGSSKAFTFTFPLFQNDTSTLKVVLRAVATGTDTTLTEGVDYTVTGVNYEYSSGGTVTTTTAYSSSYQLVLYRQTTLEQDYEISDDGVITPSAFNPAQDRPIYLAQEQSDALARSLHFPKGDGLAISAEIPSAVARAGYYLAFDSSGQPIAASGAGTNPVSAFAAGVVDKDSADDFLAALGITSYYRTRLAADANSAASKVAGYSSTFNIMDYNATGDGVADDRAAFLLACSKALAVGGTVELPPKTYLFKSAVSLTLTGDLRIVGHGAKIIMGDASGEYVNFASDYADSSLILDANVSRGDTSITVDNASSIQAGDILWISTSTKILAYGGSTSGAKEEIVEVNVVDANTIHLRQSLQWSYATTDTGLAIAARRPKKLTIEGIAFEVPDDTCLLSLQWLHDAVVKDCSLTYTKAATAWGNDLCQVIGSMRPRIENCSFDGGDDGWLGYGVEVARCRDALIKNCHFVNMWTPVAPGYWTINCTTDGMTGSGLRSPVDCHHAVGVVYRNVDVSGDLRTNGVDPEIPVGFGCFGGMLENVHITNTAAAGYASVVLLSSEYYLTADTDFYSDAQSDVILRNVVWDYPNFARNNAAFRFQASHGRRLVVENCDLLNVSVQASDAPTDNNYVFAEVSVQGGRFQRFGFSGTTSGSFTNTVFSSQIAGTSDANDYATLFGSGTVRYTDCLFSGYNYIAYDVSTGTAYFTGCRISGSTDAARNDGVVPTVVMSSCVWDGLTAWHDFDSASMTYDNCVFSGGTPTPTSGKWSLTGNGAVSGQLLMTNGIGVGNSVADTNAVPGSSNRAWPIKDASGNVIGYIPIFTSKW